MSTRIPEQSVIDGVKKLLFIGGEWRESSGDGTLDVENPSTGKVRGRRAGPFDTTFDTTQSATRRNIRQPLAKISA